MDDLCVHEQILSPLYEGIMNSKEIVSPEVVGGRRKVTVTISHTCDSSCLQHLGPSCPTVNLFQLSLSSRFLITQKDGSKVSG